MWLLLQTVKDQKDSELTAEIVRYIVKSKLIRRKDIIIAFTVELMLSCRIYFIQFPAMNDVAISEAVYQLELVERLTSCGYHFTYSAQSSFIPQRIQ